MSETSRLGPLRCPFRPCAAYLQPLVHRLDPYDESKTANVYPIHDVQGEASWYGRCPASQFVVPGLSARAQAFLAETLASYERRLAERKRLEAMQAAIGRARARIDPLLPPEQRQGDLSHDDDELLYGDAEQLGVRQGRRVPAPGDDIEHYFPGRPADGPEPGIGEEPAAPVPLGIGVTPLGKGAMSSRAETKGQLAAAAQAATEIQAGANIVLERLDAIDAAIAGMADNQQIAGAMMVAAIGTDDSAPVPAVAALTATSRVGELLNEMRASAAELRMRTESANRVAGRVHQNATEYSNTF